jgi:hypothetical protein
VRLISRHAIEIDKRLVDADPHNRRDQADETNEP